MPDAVDTTILYRQIQIARRLLIDRFEMVNIPTIGGIQSMAAIGSRSRRCLNNRWQFRRVDHDRRSWSDRSPDTAVVRWHGERRFLQRHDRAQIERTAVQLFDVIAGDGKPE